MKHIKLFCLACLLTTISVGVATAQAATASTVEAVEVVTAEKMTVKVKGVGCSRDIAAISKNVEELAGVTTCEVKSKGAISKFLVQFDPALVSEKAIYAAIEGTSGCENPNDRPYKVKL
jgi:copper chaperone CopZ